MNAHKCTAAWSARHPILYCTSCKVKAYVLQELKEYRRAGIRTFADAEVYEADKKRKSTVQPTLSAAVPGSLPRNWQYPGLASADSSLQVGHVPAHLFCYWLESCLYCIEEDRHGTFMSTCMPHMR